MKRIFTFLMIAFAALFITGCGNNDVIKNSYNSDEEIIADHFKIKIDDISYENNVLTITSLITNTSGEVVTLSPDINFRIYDSGVQLINLSPNEESIINSNQTISYTVSYNIEEKDLYELYFYSGIVENNIKITIYAKDIKNK